MHLLPPTLAKLADMAEDCTGKFALGHVHLRVHADDTFTAEATDTKALLRVSGPCVAPATDYPDSIAGLAAAPNTGTESLVPAAAWKKTFQAARKLTGRRGVPTALQSVAVKIGPTVTTFAATDAVGQQCETVENGAGKFPPIDSILEKMRGGKPKVVFAVDPLRLADLLRAVAEVACDQDDMRVEFEVNDPNRAITIRTRPRSRDGVRADAVIMPLAVEDTASPSRSEDGPESPPEVVELEKQLGNLTAKYNAVEAELDECRQRSIERAGKVDELRAEVVRLKDLLASREERIADLTRGDDFAPSTPAPARPLTRAERLAAMKGDVK